MNDTCYRSVPYKHLLGRLVARAMAALVFYGRISKSLVMVVMMMVVMVVFVLMVIITMNMVMMMLAMDIVILIFLFSPSFSTELILEFRQFAMP